MHQKKGGMFGMYDGIKVDYEERHLKPNEGDGFGVTDLIEGSLSTDIPARYTISRTYDVPNGTYSVSARANVKSGSPTYNGAWQFESQGLPLYGSPTIPITWENDESDTYDVQVTDGKLKCDFIWGKNSGYARTGFVEYVEFRYMRKLEKV
ncbi:MAG: hypothetical protein HZB68_05360 [Candidatus Aenigmarchaeota archaeon]|nr:hypothetical protein [Candidatus Aenigmarchaeota archaeon]